MSAGQQARVVKVRDRAGSGDVHVAADQNRADRGTGLKWLGLLVVADRTGAHDWDDARRSEVLGEQPQRIFAESREDQRGFDWLQEVRVAGSLLIQSSIARRRCAAGS